jgi:hypothetical protein
LLDRFGGSIGNPRAGGIVALDPQEFGRRWRIAPTPVSAVLYIEPNFGGRSALRCRGKVEMVRRLLPHAIPPISGRQTWLGDLCDTVNRAETVVVEHDDLDSAVSAMMSALD